MNVRAVQISSSCSCNVTHKLIKNPATTTIFFNSYVYIHSIALVMWQCFLHNTPVVLNRTEHAVDRHDAAEGILRYRHHLLKL